MLIVLSRFSSNIVHAASAGMYINVDAFTREQQHLRCGVVEGAVAMTGAEGEVRASSGEPRGCS